MSLGLSKFSAGPFGLPVQTLLQNSIFIKIYLFIVLLNVKGLRHKSTELSKLDC